MEANLQLMPAAFAPAQAGRGGATIKVKPSKGIEYRCPEGKARHYQGRESEWLTITDPIQEPGGCLVSLAYCTRYY